eukprot:3447487-Rhodomonas_salina.1
MALSWSSSRKGTTSVSPTAASSVFVNPAPPRQHSQQHRQHPRCPRHLHHHDHHKPPPPPPPPPPQQQQQQQGRHTPARGNGCKQRGWRRERGGCLRGGTRRTRSWSSSARGLAGLTGDREALEHRLARGVLAVLERRRPVAHRSYLPALSSTLSTRLARRKKNAGNRCGRRWNGKERTGLPAANTFSMNSIEVLSSTRSQYGPWLCSTNDQHAMVLRVVCERGATACGGQLTLRE